MPSYTHYQVGSWPSFVNEIRAVCLFEGERLQNAHSYLATKRIVNAILNLPNVQKVKVEVEKTQPPIDAKFDKISVTIEGELS